LKEKGKKVPSLDANSEAFVDVRLHQTIGVEMKKDIRK
jgi:hypothetical protein